MINSWPQSIGYRKFPEVKKRILDAAIWDMSKVSLSVNYCSILSYPYLLLYLSQVLESKVHCPKGQDLSRYRQVLQFMNIQRKQPDRKREELALQISNGGIKLATHIVTGEREWVRMR